MHDFFQQRNVERANFYRELHLYPFFRSISNSEGSSVKCRGKHMVMIGSNNYLGLTHHPHVIERTLKAVEQYGTGCTGSRFLNGNLDLHDELEERMARYLEHEAALCFSTGMQTNLGAISSLVGPRDLLVGDFENHASIIDAPRLCLGTSLKFRHSDRNNLEEILTEQRKSFRNIFIVTDGVFSMTGEVANLPDLVALAHQYDAYLYVDDAHGIGLMGPKGKGTMHYFDLADKIDFNMGTFSKSFASIGGVISGKKEHIDYIKHSARSFIFSAAMPPSALGTVLGCLEVIESEEGDRLFENLWKNVAFMRQGFEELGFFTYGSNTPIIPILVGNDDKAMKVAMALEEKGVFATPVVSPAVPNNQALIRTSYMATHRQDELQHVLEVFKALKKNFDFPTHHNNSV